MNEAEISLEVVRLHKLVEQFKDNPEFKEFCKNPQPLSKEDQDKVLAKADKLYVENWSEDPIFGLH